MMAMIQILVFRLPHQPSNALIRGPVYGPNRANRFPYHYFCSQCADWEFWQKTHALGQKLCDSKCNEYAANHTNPAYPTTLITRIPEDDDLSSDEEEEVEIGKELPVVATNEIELHLDVTDVQLGETIVIDVTLDPKIEELTATIDRLREQLVNMNVELVKAQSMLRQN
jgi:hypothetical protein